MPAIRPMFGSGQVDGDPVAISAVATPGTTVHTAITGTNHHDEITLFATNISTTDELLTLEIGGTAAGNQSMYTVPAQDGWHQVFHGRMNNGAVLAAFAGTTAVINCVAVVNRIIDPETAS